MNTGVGPAVRRASFDAAPSAIAGVTGPSPLARTVSVSPATAGCDGRPKIDPPGPAIEPSELNANACPEVLYTPGAIGAVATLKAGVRAPLTAATTFASRLISHGTCALICRVETNESRAGIPLNVTETPAIESGSDPPLLATPVAGPSPAPKIVTSDPGATG